jgi:type VI secretion system protein ImpA
MSKPLTPISEALPCGENPEYSAEFTILQSKLVPRSEVQYGDFINKPEPIEWTEIENDCAALLKKSIDISVLIWLTRARVQSKQALGLFEGLTLLWQAIQQFPDTIHPQTVLDGETDYILRANALAALADPEGLLADIRSIQISTNTVLGLSFKEVERSHLIPRPADAKAPEFVQSQLADLNAQGNLALRGISACAGIVGELNAWMQTNLGDESPNIDPLLKALKPFLPYSPNATANNAQTAHNADNPAALASVPILSDAQPQIQTQTQTQVQVQVQSSPALQIPISAQNREQASALIAQAQTWFDTHEPSSPVGILLKQAHKMVGKKFSEIAHSIPAELLQQWDQDEQD